VKETVLGRALPLLSDILANNLCQSHPPTQILEGKSKSLLYSLPDFFFQSCWELKVTLDFQGGEMQWLEWADKVEHIYGGGTVRRNNSGMFCS